MAYLYLNTIMGTFSLRPRTTTWYQTGTHDDRCLDVDRIEDLHNPNRFEKKPPMPPPAAMRSQAAPALPPISRPPQAVAQSNAWDGLCSDDAALLELVP